MNLFHRPRRAFVHLLAIWLLTGTVAASAYNARPKLVVIVVIDQFRGDYLERYYDEFGAGGFRLLMDRGAYFSNCNYKYANTRTGPGHATLGTGTYTLGHGIITNEWWDAKLNRMVTSVEDVNTKVVGVNTSDPGASPHNLLAGTFGDELKLGTQGKARVFGVSLKDRAAILPTGYSANAAYWIDHQSGAWVSSTYYMQQLPAWLQQWNSADPARKYLNREWKSATGAVLGSTAPKKDANGKTVGFYDLVGATPFANDYELDMARELIRQEKLGTGPATDLLVVSLSANDILGHRVGPDSDALHAMALALDRQLANFFAYLDKQFGLGNVWIAFSADHGVAPVPAEAQKLRIPAEKVDGKAMANRLNQILGERTKHPAEYVLSMYYPVAFLSEQAFSSAGLSEADAEKLTGEAMMQAGMRAYYTKLQLASGNLPPTPMGVKYANSYSPYSTWYVMGLPAPFSVAGTGTDHSLPYSYDTHVPLAFLGAPFKTGRYVTDSEPVDLAVTLSVLLGLNKPTSAVGRVLTEALVDSKFPAPAPVKKVKGQQ